MLLNSGFCGLPLQSGALCLNHFQFVFKLSKVTFTLQLVSLQFSHSVMSDSLQPGLQHARLPCPSPTPRACSNSCPWCHPAISSSVVPFSCCLQSFPESGTFPVNQLLASGGQSNGASASVLPMNIQGCFPLGLMGLISLLFNLLSRIFSSTTVWILHTQPLLWSNSQNRGWLLKKS